MPNQAPEPRDYFSRREQWRLLMLVMSLGLVLILINEARKPENWRWLLGNSQAEQQDPAADQDGTATWDKRIGPGKQGAQPLPEQDAPREAEQTDARPSPTGEVSSGDYAAGVNPELLATIRDNARFRAGEQIAWFHLFAVLKAADPVELRRESIGRISRLQLSKQSKAYRGELVTVRGTVRRAHWLDAPKNDDHIAGYYQTWVQPDDSPDGPIVVYCLELPDGFPTGMNLSRRAAVTGFYFKRWLHSSDDGLQLSPVILARGLQEERPRAFLDNALSLGGWKWIVIVGIAALVAALVVSYIFRRTRRTRRRPLPECIPTTEP